MTNIATYVAWNLTKLYVHGALVIIEVDARYHSRPSIRCYLKFDKSGVQEGQYIYISRFRRRPVSVDRVHFFERPNNLVGLGQLFHREVRNTLLHR